MSLYCFGRIGLKLPTAEPFTFPADVVIRRSIDVGDAEEIESLVKFGIDNLDFSICDSLNSRDATALWNEARSQSPERAMESSLGRSIHSLLFDPRILVGAIAFADGGIETILKGTPEQCWEWYLDRIVKPWDTIDNPLLIWEQRD